MAVDVLLQRRPFAAAVALGELLGQLVEQGEVARKLSPDMSETLQPAGHGARGSP